MSVVYSGGPYRNDLYTGISTRQGLIEAINLSVIGAGWNSVPFPACSGVAITGQPNNNDTLTLNGVTYTFVTSINNAISGQVLIDASTLLSYTNMFNAVNGGPGSGSKYSSATTIHPNMACNSVSSTFLRVYYKVGSTYAGNGVAISSSLTNAAVVRSTLWAAGHQWTSQQSPQGMQFTVFAHDTGFTGANGATPRFRVGNVSLTSVSHVDPATVASDAGPAPTVGYGLGLGNGTSWRAIVSPYSFYAFADGLAGSTPEGFFWAFTPYLATFIQPIAILAASNTSPISITTNGPHGRTTGNQVWQDGVGGNSGANGSFTITVTGLNTFTLNGSNGTGLYTSGGFSGVISAGNQGASLANAIFAGGSENGTPMLAYQLHNGGEYGWSCINGQTVGGGTSAPTGKGVQNIVTPVPGVIANDVTENTTFYNGAALVTDALIAASTASATASYIVGQIYDAVLMKEPATKEATGTFDSHNWFNLTDNNNGNGSGVMGSILVVVT